MHEHVWNVLVEDSVLRFDRIIERLGSSRFPMSKEKVFLPIIKAEDSSNHYLVDSFKPIPGLQCVLMLDDPSNNVLKVEVDDNDRDESDDKKSKKSKDSYIPLNIPSNYIGSIKKV